MASLVRVTQYCDNLTVGGRRVVWKRDSSSSKQLSPYVKSSTRLPCPRLLAAANRLLLRKVNKIRCNCRHSRQAVVLFFLYRLLDRVTIMRCSGASCPPGLGRPSGPKTTMPVSQRVQKNAHKSSFVSSVRFTQINVQKVELPINKTTYYKHAVSMRYPNMPLLLSCVYLKDGGGCWSYAHVSGIGHFIIDLSNKTVTGQ